MNPERQLEWETPVYTNHVLKIVKRSIFLVAIALALLTFAIPIVRAQPGTNEWVQLLPGEGVSGAVAVDSFGNIFVARGLGGTVKFSAQGAELWSNNITGGNQAIAVDGAGNAFVTGTQGTVKYSTAGAPVWTNSFPGVAMVLDGAGNVIVVDTVPYSVESWSYETVKFSGTGIPLWTNFFNLQRGSTSDYAQAVAVDSAGNVFVTGTSEYIYSGYPDPNSAVFATVKYSGAGLAVWTNTYNGDLDLQNFVQGIAVDGSGDAIVTGSSGEYFATNGIVSLIYATIKYSSSGTTLWTNRFYGPTNTSANPYAIAVDAAENILVTGTSTDPTSGHNDFTTLKYSSTGAVIWTEWYAGPSGSDSYPQAIAVDAAGSTYVNGISGVSNNNAMVTIRYSDGGVPLWTNVDANEAFYKYPGGSQSLAVTPDGVVTLDETLTNTVVQKISNGFVPPQVAWQADFGGTNDDVLVAAEPTTDGGFILGGYTYSATASGNKTNPIPAGSVVPDWWLVKTDGGGTKQWERNFGGSGIDSLNAIAPAAGGGYLLAGYSSSPPNPPTKTVGTYGDRDYWLMRVDGNGNPLWQTNFGGTSTEYGETMVATTDGGCLIGGHSSSTASGNKASVNYGSYDYWLVKVDANGNKQWDKSFGGSGDDELGDHSVQQTSDGGYIVAGLSSSGASGTKTSGNFGSYDYWILKLDSNGNKIWEQDYGGSGDDEPNAVRQTSDGGYIIVGYSTSGASGNKTTGNHGGEDIWVLKLDANGSKQWEQDYGGTNDDYVGDVQQTPDGGYLVGATTSSSASGNLSSINHGGQDFWLLKLDANGNKLWESTYGGTNDDILVVLQLLTNNAVLLAGRSQSTNVAGDKTVPGYGGKDYWMIELAASPPSLVVGSQSRTNLVGTTATFAVMASGTGAFQYQWQKNGQNLTDQGNVSGSGSATLTLANVQPIDAGNYSASIANTYGSTNAIYSLTVVIPAGITNQPQSQTNLAGTVAAFTVGVNGTAPLAYQWRKNGMNLSDGGNVSGSASSALSLANVQLADAAGYDLIVSNNYDSVTSSVATLTVVFPAGITNQPQSQTNLAGTMATFTVGATGTAPLSYQWRKGGTNLFDGGNISGSANSTLSLSNVQSSDASDYDVVVGNNYGSVTSSLATLTIYYCTAPVIASQPENASAILGGTATFSVSASGSGLSYRWLFSNPSLPTTGPISTVAGDGVVGYNSDGITATNSELNYPLGVAVDNLGNVFIADRYNNRIRKVDVNGVITTVAGGGSSVGGPATNAALNNPISVAVDSLGDLFIADVGSQSIRKVDTNGMLSVVAGVGSGGYGGDGGPATNAYLSYSYGVGVDNFGNVFIADSGNNRIRRVDTNGIITTVAGIGSGGYNGDGIAATNAWLNSPYDVQVDSLGNLFIADYFNNRIRKVDTNGIITTVAGVSGGGYNGDGILATNAALAEPAGVAIDQLGNVFIADVNNERIRKVAANGIITTVAGTGTPYYNGDGITATNANLTNPYRVALDNSGNLFIADSYAQRIRKVPALPANFIVSGPALVISNVSSADAGNYSVIISDDCGSVTSSIATLTIPPYFVSLPVFGGNGFQFTLSGATNKNYVLQASTNLGQWTPIETNIPTTVPFYFTDPNASNYPARFYRVLLQP